MVLAWQCASLQFPAGWSAFSMCSSHRNMYPHVIEGVRKLAAAGVWIEFPPPPVFRWWYTPVFEDSNVVKEPEEDTHQKLYLSAYGANLLLRLARHEGLTATDVVELSWEACKSQWKGKQTYWCARLL